MPRHWRMETPAPKPGYASLRRFRRSASGAEYFITTNLHARGSGLEREELTAHVRRQWLKLEEEHSWQVKTAVIMPDHVHLLIRLGPGITITECMRRFKGRLVPQLRLHQAQWQEGYYEHEIRESEDRLPVFLYIYLNPYRAKLVATGQAWPGYYCCPDDWAWFGVMTRNDLPQPEWLR